MAFELIRELNECIRENGLKRLLLALYSTESGSRYIALSEQVKPDADSSWISNRKGITIRRGEIASIISALQSADFDAKSDGNKLSPQEYSRLHLDWT